jgi:hypothetical protein
MKHQPGSVLGAAALSKSTVGLSAAYVTFPFGVSGEVIPSFLLTPPFNIELQSQALLWAPAF